MKKVEKLTKNVYLIDGFDLNVQERTGTYVLTESELTIIETSASPSVPYIIEGLKELGYSPKDIKYIIVTHIHLDHAGGAGLLLQQCPEAKVIVHPKGKRHLADPSRLIAGARAVYGDKFDTLFDPIIPIPEDCLLEKNDRETLAISEDCILTFYDTPGHANHHFSVYHSNAHAMFTGDTVGIRYSTLLEAGVEFYLPSTSPNQFDPKKMQESIELYKSLDLDGIFFGHYGLSQNPNEVYKQVTFWLKEFIESGKKGYSEGKTPEEQADFTSKELVRKVTLNLEKMGIPRSHEAFTILHLDMEVCSMGLIDYLHKQNHL